MLLHCIGTLVHHVKLPYHIHWRCENLPYKLIPKRKKSQGMKSVVHGHQNDILLDNSAHPVEVLGAEGEASTMYPNHHGEGPRLRVKGRGEHIEGEAVF